MGFSYALPQHMQALRLRYLFSLQNPPSTHNLYYPYPQPITSKEIYIISRLQYMTVRKMHYHKTLFFYLQYSTGTLCQKTKKNALSRSFGPLEFYKIQSVKSRGPLPNGCPTWGENGASHYM